MELISVIIPVYNVESFLCKCIESVQNQTYKNLEILIIDDGSTDKCPQICDEYASKDPRIKVIHQKNAGLSAARNTGLDIAKGEYIFFVDSDDYLLKDALRILLDEMKKSQADMVVCDWLWADVDGAIEKREPSECFRNEILSGIQFLHNSTFGEGRRNVVAWNKLYKKSIFEHLKFEIGKIHEDEFVFHEICGRCKFVCVIEDALYIHVRRPGSIIESGITLQTLDGIEAYLARVVYLSKIKNTKKAFYNTLGEIFRLLFNYASRMGFDNEELNLLMKRKRKNVLKILPLLLQDTSRCFKERISVSILLLWPWLYGKIWT